MTGRALVFTVDREPMGQPRARTNGAQRFHAGPIEAYREQIAWCARAAGARMIEGPVRVTVAAVFAMPASWSKAKADQMLGTPVTKKPDADNVAKAVLDALNGIAWRDDAAVADLHTSKRWGRKGAVIVTVEGMGR